MVIVFIPATEPANDTSPETGARTGEEGAASKSAPQ